REVCDEQAVSAQVRHVTPARARFVDGDDEIRGQRRFRDVTDAAGCLRSLHQLLVVVDGEKNDPDGRFFATQTPGDFETAHSRHGDVEYDDIRAQPADGFKRRN